MKKQPVYPGGENTATGAYTPGITVGDLIFVSGQGPLNPDTKQFELRDIEHQTRQTLDNVRRVLVAAGSDLTDVVKVTVHLRDINDFARFNEAYKQYFPEPRPARTTVQSGLGSGIGIEIDVIAVRGCGDGRDGED